MKNLFARVGRTLLSAALVALLLPAAALAQTDAAAAAGGTLSVASATAAAGAAGATVAATAADEGTADEGAAYEADSIIVGYDDADASASEAAECADAVEEGLAEAGLAVDEELAVANDDTGTIALVSVPENVSVEEAIEEAADAPGVAYAQPNYMYKLLEDGDADAANDDADDSGDAAATSVLPDDPAAQTSDTSVAANQYYLYGDNSTTTGTKGANLTEAWSYATTAGDVTVVVMDTGVNLTHEDLAANVLTSYCYDIYNSTQLTATSSFNGDYYGHGTHVAGIIAGEADNGTGIAGTSYNANIIAYKIFDDDTMDPSADTASLVSAYSRMLEVAEEHPELNIRVVNLSLGMYEEEETGPGGFSGPGQSQSDDEDEAMLSVIEQAREEGILTVCAGGNGDDRNNPYTTSMYPADWDACLAVTALEADGTNATWSDFNEDKDISAPGVGIYSTYNEGTSSYETMDGTSMASPVVAGSAALLWAAVPDASVDEVVEAITATADEVDDSNDRYRRNSTGYRGTVSGSAGAINAGSAVQYLLAAWEEEHCSAGEHTGGMATCAAAATCVVCGESYGDVDANAHVYDEGTITAEATCTEAGTITYTCSICGAAYVEELAATGHSFTTYVSNADATCTADGTKTATCDNGCGETSTLADEGSATGHSWGAGVVTKTATATKAGVRTYTCSVCGATRTTAVAALGKAANTLTVKGKKATVKGKTKSGKLKRKVTLARARVLTVKKAKGKVTFARGAVKLGGKKVTGAQLKKIVVNKKTGKLTLKKGLKKGTYKVRVKVKAAGTSNYKAKTKTVTVVIRVK